MNPLDPDTKQIFTWIGALTVGMQTTERIVDLAMTFVFPAKEKLTLQMLERLERQQRSRTLGRLAGQLRERVNLHPELVQLLDNFVEHRNQLAHRVHDIPGWNLETAEGRKVAIDFLDQLQKEDLKVLQIFLGALIVWENQHKLGIVKDLPPEIIKIFPEIPAFKVVVNAPVFAKQDIAPE